MSEGLWLPAGPLTRASERGAWPPVGQGSTGAGLVMFGVAFTAPFVALTDRQEFPFQLDPVTGRLLVAATSSPPSPIDATSVAIDGVAGVNQILVVAPAPGSRIRIFHLSFLSRGPGTVKFHDSAGAPVTGTFTASGTPAPGSTQIGWAFDAPGGVCPDPLPLGVGLQVDVSAGAVAIDGKLLYTVGP